MRSRNWQIHWLVAGAALAVSCFASSASAQGDPKPISRPGGYASTELSSIYRQGVGQGYTSASLNSLALQNARVQVGNYGQSTVTPGVNVGRSGGFGGFRPSSSLAKPFASFSSSPTTSPYLNLFREDFEGGGDFNYNTLVRPQLQQQQFNQQLQRQSIEMSRRLQSISAQGAFNPQGAKDQSPTGHDTAMRYYGHYYPTAPYRPGKQAP